MFYHIFKYLGEYYDIPGSGMFQYISFRAAAAIILALLIVISLIISWLRYIPVVLDRLQKPKPTTAAPAASAARDAAGGMQAASGDDRRKLAAVITAAIAAYEAEHGQAASGDDYVVRNIRRIRHEAK